VSPDYFSAEGQKWGNPLYRWSALKETGYEWWVQRIHRTLELVDYVRVDHFRGFESYWEVGADEPNAVRGRWVPGPGAPFFREVERRLGALPLIAEDLGLITPEVEELRDELGFPGMRVLQFAFDGEARNPHLPENHVPLSIAYTGTHDNDTIMGWWASATREEQARVRERCGGGEPSNWSFIESVFDSAADLAIVPIQDVLGLGSDARINTPGSPTDNWTWRLAEVPTAALARRLHDATRESGRAPGTDSDAPGG
jgi:4-alpha-glucanotransferase